MISKYYKLFLTHYLARIKNEGRLLSLIGTIKYLISSRFWPKPNVYSGYRLYDKPLLMSYSRSGTNWVRYFIETISKKPTPGQTRILDGKEYFFDRAHAGYKVLSKYNSTILLLRDYKECIIRQHSIEKVRAYNSLTEFLDDDTIFQPALWYINNIQEFDRFSGKKLLIYYEDLIENPVENIKLIGNFLGLAPYEVEQFCANINTHKEKSLRAYVGGNHVSSTKGSANELNYHAKKNLEGYEIIEFNKYFRQRNLLLFTKYLKRYDS